ncbi:hypothetical protein ECLT68_0598 [Escherichia coli LT-68]|nr:hypothetical protein ECLT68_0598 [Escherichia coli LT-68]
MDMNPMLDYCFTPALRQTISHTGIKNGCGESEKFSSKR